ncbi:HI0074 family nucleotidyltransferase substrate-binding subunit [Neisseria perflava]|uniref:HI0074 family nucleotidyltransferase substrate-binding subunit n=1 Tax=Neisseria perflava TaxID=33053 RepID=UPI0020A06D87|nr:HI0074 family nucleotidyltransferase substrate-binding subunit [Neisseria perflava]MCP1660480.1 nucleotidyltransferase substrate binding protein (TIGR01987 family) [Neisseria perflava]MCP1772029.1 nucleotidyltransferase substrate binding protein (TIGR01987 family) [Neisseria perflava]
MAERLILTAFEDAFQSLADTAALLADEQWMGSQAEIVRETLIAGAIQKFEFVYELGLKMLRRQLAAEAVNPDEVQGADFRDLLRLGLQSSLIDNMDDWLFYRKLRNITSHTYDKSKALEVYAAIGAFLDSSRLLLQGLQKRNA